MKKDSVNAMAINEGIRSLQYNPKEIVAFKGNVVSNYVPNYGEIDSEGKYVVTTYTKHTVDGDYDIAVPNASVSYTYPGALLIGNQSLVDGTPKPLSVKRDKAIFTVNLPNLVLSGIEVENPTYNNVLDAIRLKLERHYNNSIYSIPAEIQSKCEMVYDKKTMELIFGCDVDYLAQSVGLNFDLIKKQEQSAFVFQFKQIYYSVSMEPCTHPAEVFSEEVEWDDIEHLISNENPPVYVQNVQYGREIYFILKANSTTEELDAFINANLNINNLGITANIVDEEFAKCVSCSMIVRGGNPDTIKTTGNAMTTEIYDRLNEAICQNVVLSRENPAIPLCYLTMFLKDNEPISVHGTTEYLTSESVTYDSGELILKHNAGYVGYFYVDWKTEEYYTDENGEIVCKKVDHSWPDNGKKKTAGMEKVIALPANTVNLHVRTEGETGVAWDPRSVSFDSSNIPLIKSRTIQLKGTTLNQKVIVDPQI